MNHPKIPTAKSPGKLMEAPRSIGGRIQRKPLADCTNIVSRSSQQSSSSVKFANPSLTSSLKRLVDLTTLKEKPKDVSTSAAASENTSRSLATNVRRVTRRMSVDLGTPASAPSRPQTSQSDLDVSDKELAEPVLCLDVSDKELAEPVLCLDVSDKELAEPVLCLDDSDKELAEPLEPLSVYTVRRKRNKDTSSSSRAVTRSRLDLTSSSGKKTCQVEVPKTQKVAPKKRQRTVKKEKKSVRAASQDYIEQQKAYFAEIDAFELPVEELSCSDED